MTSEPPGLLAATQRRTADTRSRARSTIRRMDHEGQLINFVTVAREARISRDLLYRDPELRAAIERLRTGRSTTPRLPSAQRASQESLIQRLHGLRAEITVLREENQFLRTHLAARLGEERAAGTPKTEREKQSKLTGLNPVKDMSATHNPIDFAGPTRWLQIINNIAIKHIKGTARCYRSLDNYRSRILLRSAARVAA